MVIMRSNASQVAAQFKADSAAIRVKTKKVLRHHGQLLLTRIQAKASGRPGPNAPTGDYRRSWGMQTRSTQFTEEVSVGTNAPQGRRLELGFYGADSLGRVYNQPPYEHVTPACDEVFPKLAREFEKIVP